ncbi:MAG: hypothetical protein J7J22_04655 [Candidatus Verstraetearchaeota archaeon]|nr:hypothetical protein [Candidatus Verstraetearchaeota archaeon]
MSMVFHVKMYALTDAKIEATLEQFGKSAVDLATDDWETKMKGVRSYINSALDQVIPNADTYRNIMHNRALPALQNVFNSAHPKYNKIINKFRAKQAGAYSKWKTNKDSAFTEGGAFDTGITNAKDSWKGNAKIVMKVVGVRPLMLGPAPKLMMWLSGDTKVQQLRDIDLDTVWEGTPTNVLDPNLPYLVRQTVIPIIVEGIQYAEYYNNAGLESDRDSWLSDYSTKLNNLLSKIIDTGSYTVATAVIAFDTSVSNYYVEVQINSA